MAYAPTTIDVRVRTVPDDALCIDCRWWKNPIPLGLAMGVCRRRAPHVQPAGEYQFPVTRADDICGEWEAKP